MTGNLIYKILPRSAWEVALEKKVLSGHGIDLEDGFIHFSAGSQVAGTLGRYFTGQADLVLLAVRADGLSNSLRWEESRDGEQFPHVYGNVPIEVIEEVYELPLDDNGLHQLPESLE
ncbi:DUF952 domain-containing protein [Stieleria sp. JC731]|uniref:DUF952 domain-containing protein n=1 Tax=Pirellulaceae TaxID=2691357 RepID=UPI001E35B6F1|nr:DUF952 domain-containing protein [Stieleria sp. JC731]MCC9602635.1 DUF952 domain-containing protein [Stieleria sp. JC731]